MMPQSKSALLSPPCRYQPCYQPPELLPVLGVEHLGRSIKEYLAHCLIPINEHHMRILLEHHKIHHWTHFCYVSTDKVIDLGISAGAAQALVDGLAYYIHMLKKNKKKI
jgi:hypothetical protein